MLSRKEAQCLVDKMNLVLKTTPFHKAVMTGGYAHRMGTLLNGGWRTKVIELSWIGRQVYAKLRLAEKDESFPWERRS